MAVRRLVLALALLVCAAPAARAQVAPDTAAARRAPRPYVAPRLAFSVMLGTGGPGEIQTQRVLAERLNAAGTAVSNQVLGRTLSADGGLQVGLSALLGLTPAWAVRVGATWGQASLGDGYSGVDTWSAAAEDLTVTASNDLTVLSAEGALRFRMRSGRRVQPYAELGVAAVRIEADDPSFPGAEGLTGDTRLAGVAGVGAIIPVWRRLSARVQATRQLLGNSAVQAPGGALVAAGDTLRVTFMDPAEGPFADPARELLGITRLDVGLSLELGTVARPRAARAARPIGSRP